MQKNGIDVLQLLTDHLDAILVFLASSIAVFIGHLMVGDREKRKEKRVRRAESIARWRVEIDKLAYWIDQGFQDSSTYAEIKNFLPEEIRQRIEYGRGAFSVTPRAGVLSEGESLKQMVLDEITRVERDVWRLT